MNELPRWLVPVIRLALTLAFVGITAFQLVGLPAIVVHDLGVHDATFDEIAFITPLILIFAGLALCLQVIIVCTGRLLTLVARDEIFSPANTRWVDGIVRAMVVGWFLCAGLAPYCFLIGFEGDAPGILLMGFMFGLVVTAVLGLMLVMRELLRRATDLRSDMDAVI